MEITRPTIDTSLGMHAWMERRRDEFHRTTTPVRVAGAVGWAWVALSAVIRLG